ncbi:hypothetical protein CRM22_003392 [Opisthorchis felineus]|uniref:Uncharacterized protein n=1 Tax=Opisthorchis felineus TaxID=147828 RepID=A0A4S2M6D1_OPIFE|nr:hypothetical protein CRM22_003392 [Opisthorchis felineus]
MFTAAPNLPQAETGEYKMYLLSACFQQPPHLAYRGQVLTQQAAMLGDACDELLDSQTIGGVGQKSLHFHQKATHARADIRPTSLTMLDPLHNPQEQNIATAYIHQPSFSEPF